MSKSSSSKDSFDIKCHLELAKSINKSNFYEQILVYSTVSTCLLSISLASNLLYTKNNAFRVFVDKVVQRIKVIFTRVNNQQTVQTQNMEDLIASTLVDTLTGTIVQGARNLIGPYISSQNDLKTIVVVNDQSVSGSGQSIITSQTVSGSGQTTNGSDQSIITSQTTNVGSQSVITSQTVSGSSQSVVGSGQSVSDISQSVVGSGQSVSGSGQTTNGSDQSDTGCRAFTNKQLKNLISMAKKQNASGTIYECQHGCNFSSKTERDYSIHLVGHVNIDPSRVWECSKCNYKSTSQTGKTVHLKNSH
jgi:hypothetical protein